MRPRSSSARRLRARHDYLRPFRCLLDFRDDDSDAIAHRKILEPRLVTLAQFGFGLPKFDDNVSIFETFDDAVHHFTDVLVIFRVDALALGFTDFLEDHLLRHLGRDAAQPDRRLLELEFFLKLSVGFYVASFTQRNFADWIG